MINLKDYLSEETIDLLGDQVAYYRWYLDIFIEDYYGVKLYDQQKIIARAAGRFTEVNEVNSRGAGKTWLLALIAHAMCVLYPGTFVAVVSGTAEQATLVLEKLEQMLNNPAILRELDTSMGRKPVTVNQSKGKAVFKNGSKIESYSIRSIRGRRAKIVIVDEAPLAKANELDSAVSPIKNFRRDVCHSHGIRDYKSKVFNISSACEKSNHFYDETLRIVREMGSGSKESFAIALDWRAAVREGITDLEYFEAERKRMPQSKFDMEYGSIFLGEEANSMFPYSIIEACRTMGDVELVMPKGSGSSYVMGVDIATSSARSADNSVISVVKLFEHSDGSIGMKMVYMRSYKGQGLDLLAREVRRTYVRFPGMQKIVFDQRGLGDSFPKFLDEPWVDPSSGKEYPPFVLDDERSISSTALPILRSVKATVAINQSLATSLRVALEQRKLALPMNSRNIVNGKLITGSVLSQDGEGEDVVGRKLTLEEQAIFIEADALQFEMGNIVATRSASGNFTYDTARKTQHKDRYSSLSMAVLFVSELEAEAKRRINRGFGDAIGLATNY